MIDPKRKKHVILISKPFMFDNRQLPKSYEGLDIKAKIEGMLPKEFSIVPKESPKKEYLWAPNKFEKYVDRCSEEIRAQFGNPKMTRKERLIHNLQFVDNETGCYLPNTQYKLLYADGTLKWVTLRTDGPANFNACAEHEMRIAQNKISVNGIEIDAPMTEEEFKELESDGCIYTITPEYLEPWIIERKNYHMRGDYITDSFRRLLKRGFIFNTEEKAEAYCKAMGWIE